MNATTYCSNCGGNLTPNAKFCSACGKPSSAHSPTQPKVDSPTGMNRVVFSTWIGGLLVISGITGAAYFYLFFDTSVSVPSTELFGQRFGGGRVNNLGLMAERQNGLVLSIGAIVIGFIIEAIAKGRK